MNPPMLVKQHGSVEEYKREFSQLTFYLLLYETDVSDTLLVTHFVLGLKEELRVAIDIKLPTTISEVATYALIQEGILSRDKTGKYPVVRTRYQNNDLKVWVTAGWRTVESQIVQGV